MTNKSQTKISLQAVRSANPILRICLNSLLVNRHC